MIADLRQWLRAYLLPMNISEAGEFLHLARSSSQYLDLYRRYFPAEFEQSMQRNHRRWLIPLPGDAYTVFEVQFLKLVDRHLFPIPEYVFDDPCEENRCFVVPIEPNGLASIYEVEDAVCDMDLGWQLLLYLGGQLQFEFFDGMFDAPTDGIFDLEIEQGQVYGSVLRERCAEREGPLSYFRMAIAMLDHDTGTIFLDATYDMPVEDACWDRETVDALAKQCVESEEIWDKAMQCIRWLEEDVLHHFTEVVELWNLSIRESQTPRTEVEEEQPKE